MIFRYDGSDLKVLLIERGIDPFKCRRAFTGGIFNLDEDAITGASKTSLTSFILTILESLIS